jgi:hypothetical protein
MFLRSQFSPLIDQMSAELRKLPIEQEMVYAQFLAQTYYYVSHSTRLLAFAAGVMSLKEKQLFKRYIHHISEESSHELLAQKDLEGIGYSVMDFREFPETKMLWEAQYTKIWQKGASSFLGYIIALESFAVAAFPEFLQRLNQVNRFQGHVRFVKLHAEEDIDHIEKACHFVELLSEEEQAEVFLNIEQTALSYNLMLNACREKVYEEKRFSHFSASV